MIELASGSFRAIISQTGAELQSLTRDGTEFLWQGDPAIWSGRSPILFPVVGRSPDGHIAIDDFVTPMPKHGFARTAVFDVAALTASAVRLRMGVQDQPRPDWPFLFHLDLVYALGDTGLSITAEVYNGDIRPMPYCIGLHPAFNWPIPMGEGPFVLVRPDGGEPALSRIVDEVLVPCDAPSPFIAGTLVLDHALFVEDALVFPDGAGPGLTYRGTTGPRIDCVFDNLPDLGIWTKPDAPYICIEPWSGVDARAGQSLQMGERPNVVWIAAGETGRHRMDIRISG